MQAGPSNSAQQGRFYIDEPDEATTVDSIQAGRLSSNTDGYSPYASGSKGVKPYRLNDDVSELDGEDPEADSDDLSTTSGRRHGALLLPEEADMVLYESQYMTQWTQKRHQTGGNPKPLDERDLPDWRMRERLRTMSAALVMCLNIGVDPPDVSKTNPCSKLICWMDPGSIEVSKALPAIGRNLQAQFETLSTKTRYKLCLDPTVEDTKRYANGLRKQAKDERLLFYYNGFGVPKPTPGGEIWVFNKAYTQYIPVTLYDLQTWLGNPCIFVWDCSSAGNVVVNFKRLAERRAEEENRSAGGSRARSGSAAANGGHATTSNLGEEQQFHLRESIHLAACGPDEVLPMNPDLPADLFTCCLTSPIEISLRWFILQNPLPSQLNSDMVMNIPGRLQDRRTPLGELNWIFTAITDTIAWTVLPRTIFRRLFRDDLMVAALLRNFLLAERIMRFYHCTPMSHPKLPETHNHPLWDSWDLAVDQCLSQLPTLLAKEEAAKRAAEPDGPPMEPHLAAYEYRHSTFFSEQLMAFEVWLSQGGVSRRGRRRGADASKTLESHLEEGGDEAEESDDQTRAVRTPPDQLPIVLQVLLSQVHRLRALILLSQFLDLGPWAVNMALSIGIFPYVLKLLQSPAADLKPVLIYIWARILAVDRSCQNDLLRDNGFVYFSTVLSPFQQPAQHGAGGQANANNYPIPNVSEHRAMCAFILAVFCQDFSAGQQACLQTDAMDSCLEHLDHDDFLLRQWSALCIGQLWDNSSVGKARGIGRDVHGKFACMLSDISPEVRAAVLYAMGTLLGASGSSYEAGDRTVSRHTQNKALCLGTGTMLEMDESRQRSLEIGIAVSMLSTRCDPSSLVRKELVIALSPFVREYQGFFVLVAYLYHEREERKLRQRNMTPTDSVSGLDAETVAYEEAMLTRIVTKLSLEEGVDEVDIANIPTFSTLFVSLLDLSADSHPEVASLACTVVDYINALMLTLLPAEQMGVATSADRLMTPTSTAEHSEGYFPPMPRSKMSTANDRALNASSLGLGRAPSSSTLSASRASPHNANSAGNHHHPHYNRRSTSLAQTVKAIATLGYSRPASPSNEEGDSNDSSHRSSSDAPHRSAFLPPRVPAPRRQNTRYVSPFVPAADGRSRRSSDAHDPSDSSLSSTTASAAHRSASAESLAHIARMQERRTARQAASSTQPNTPVVGGRTQLPNRYTTGLTPTNAHRSSGSHDHSPTVSGPHSRNRSPFSESGVNHKIADTLAAIVAVDLQRFRDRHLIADENAEAHFVSMAGHTPMHSPGGGQLDGGQTIREVLPLKSSLFAWCSEYYTEPQMKCAEADEPGSVQYNIQTWKRERNERLMSEAQADVDNVLRAPWRQNTHVSGLATGGGTAPGVQIGAPAYLMRLHQFENHLVTASEQDTISVWDWTTGKLLTRFNNGNPPKTSITSMAFVNEDAQTRFLVGSADGDVRVYANYDEPSWSAGRGPKLVSSMRALPHLVRSKRPSGLIFDWQQISGSLLTAGDSRFIRVWDAHRELCICDIPTRVSSCVTSISSETDVGHIFVCGYGDGTIGVYDRRIPPELSLVRLWEEHSNWITNVHLQKRGNRELVSASTDGVVKVWDIRGRNSLKSKDWSGELRGKLSAMDVHDSAPIFALSSYPKPQKSGMGPQRTLLCNIETQEVLGNTRPIDRHFAASFDRYAQANASTASTAHSSTDSSYQHGLSGHGTAGGVHQHVGHTAVLSPAIDSPPSYFRPGMGSMAFHPHFPLLAFAGPDSLGFVGLTRCQVDVHGSKSGLHAAQYNTTATNGTQLMPYSYIGYGGYGHGAASVLDGDEQRHIPSLPNNTSDIPRSKSLFSFVG
jgi:regulator-associated protein of mTOR